MANEWRTRISDKMNQNRNDGTMPTQSWRYRANTNMNEAAPINPYQVQESPMFLTNPPPNTISDNYSRFANVPQDETTLQSLLRLFLGTFRNK